MCCVTLNFYVINAVDETFYDAINYILLFCIDKQKIKQKCK